MNSTTVAIVGRPNVGKSTLFNALARRRISIAEPTSGVTRDRISTAIESPEGSPLELLDTGGMGVGDRDVLADDVEEQIRYAVAAADVFLFVVDGSEGVVSQDSHIANHLRTLGKPVVLVANKVESAKSAATAGEFHELGLGEPMLVSALHRRGTGELRSKLFAFAAGARTGEATPSEMKMAIVGQRNVGKSTFINTLANEKRVIVSELPGTTRDSVDVRFERDGKVFVAIDTAGLRKKRQVSNAVEFYGQARAQESIRRADVVLLMLDAQNKISQVDKKIAAYICQHLKPCVVVVNKWDLAGDVPTGKYLEYLAAGLPALRRAPVAFVCALKNKRVQKTIDLARSLWKQARLRVPTPQLNRVIEELKRAPQRAGRGARRPKIYYGTQVATAPPTIVLFVNSPERFSEPARRFITHFLRTHLPFEQVPVAVRYKKAIRPGG